MLQSTDIGKEFLVSSPTAQEITRRVNSTIACHSNTSAQQIKPLAEWKDSLQNWGILINSTLDSKLTPRVYKGLKMEKKNLLQVIQLISEQMNYFLKEEIQGLRWVRVSEILAIQA